MYPIYDYLKLRVKAKFDTDKYTKDDNFDVFGKIYNNIKNE